MAGTEAPFRFRWTAREGWGDGYFDGAVGRWKVAHITPAGGKGGNADGQARRNMPIVMHWQLTLPGHHNGEDENARLAARAVETAFPRIVLTHPRFTLRVEDEDMLRVVLELPMPAVLLDELEVHMRHVRERGLEARLFGLPWQG